MTSTRAPMPSPEPITWLDRPPTPTQRRSAVLRAEIAALTTGERHHTTHSAMGGTLQAVVRGMEEARRPYLLIAQPGVGYMVTSLADEHLELAQRLHDRLTDRGWLTPEALQRRSQVVSALQIELGQLLGGGW